MDFTLYSEKIRKLHEDYKTCIGDSDERVFSVLKELMEEAIILEDSLLIGFTYHARAYAEYFISGRYGEFLSCLRLSSRYLLHCGDSREMKHVYYLICIDAMNRGLYDIAYHYAILARNEASEANEPDSEGILDGMVAYTLMQMGNFRDALKYVRRSRKGITAFPEHPLYAINLAVAGVNEGMALIETGMTEKAEKIYWETLDYMHKEGISIGNDTWLDLEILGTRIEIASGDGALPEKRVEKLCAMTGNAVQIVDHIDNLCKICNLLLARGKTESVRKILDAISKHRIPDDALNSARLLIEVRIDYLRRSGDAKALREAYKEQEKILARAFSDSGNNYAYVKDLVRLINEMQQEQEKIRAAYDAVKHRAKTDVLTGISNRYALNTFVEEAYERAYGNETRLGICIMDLDGLKAYNDTYGHAAGDACLEQVGTVLANTMQEKDFFAARYGGDEFVFVFEDRSDKEIEEILNVIRERLPLSASFGVSNEIPDDKHRSFDYLSIADSHLYREKEGKKTGNGGAA